MADAKMELRMWTFGPEQELSLQNVEPISPVLGLKWDRIEDSLFIPFKSEPISNLSKKRKLLSIVHSVFDPLGFVVTVMVPAKLILQEAWATEENWDLPGQMNYNLDSQHESESSGPVYVKFVAAKSRISPLKKVTIPRLELLACVLGSRLAKYVVTALSLKEVPTYYWTDAHKQEKHFHEKENSVHGLQVVRGDDDVLRGKTSIIERDDELSFLYQSFFRPNTT
ncbi:reverse transcriptase [Caerostris extrusa]|uniref:Reverse transcriptase n=1 Tax=Caerostris extrusa TaxID=172846 RepID=A0AAV4QM03_CAEEX|nr:reverse transcriptase [Caerostris extrusa]